MDAVFENHFSNDVISMTSQPQLMINGASHVENHVTSEPITDNNFEVIFESSTTDCTDIYSELPPLNERKIALERQLQTRRDCHTLQSQGILPPPNAPPHYYSEAKHLERARVESLLKKKIAQRPEKKTLIEYHILEETNVSPLIIEPQKKLQKAQLAHRLSEKISVRPGPLELIEKGILENDNLQLQNAIRNGQVHYDKVDSIYNINPGSVPPNFFVSDDSPLSAAHSPPTIDKRPHSVAEIRSKFNTLPSSTQPQTPLPNPRRSNSNLRIKKSKNRSKFKFHVYEPTVKRKENYNNQNNKNVIQNYENRLKQQQTLLHEMDKLQTHIERSIPVRNNQIAHSIIDQSANQENFQVRNSPFIRLNNEIKAEPVMIAPSPVPTGDQTMVDIEQRNRQKMRPVARVEKLVQKFENNSVIAPPPIHFKAPPTPPPVEHLENTSVLKFEPERISEYKVKELKAILRENNLTITGTKEALIKRLMHHHGGDKPKPKPGKLKVKFEYQEVNLDKMREEMELMRKTIEEKNKIIHELSAQGSSGLNMTSSIHSPGSSTPMTSSDLTSSTETITSEVSNLTNDLFQPRELTPDRRLFTSPSAPVLNSETNCLDDIMDFSPGLGFGVQHNSSKYSDRDSGVNSQENLSDMMGDKFQDSSMDWLDLQNPLDANSQFESIFNTPHY